MRASGHPAAANGQAFSYCDSLRLVVFSFRQMPKKGKARPVYSFAFGRSRLRLVALARAGQALLQPLQCPAVSGKAG
jgi:hypothetical protein